ncbi:unnamed protein product [Cuscuta campestris]|uniref:Uncharacterized protein n=1 Tax=Cuscuta campestris TaxID=132261 RepID=A0A484LYT0_9ASTE|nr:unnamed protein product [Cuscuta campestris]
MPIIGASSLTSSLSVPPPVSRSKPITAAAGNLMSFSNIRKTITTSLPVFHSYYVSAIKTLDPFVAAEKTSPTTQPPPYYGGGDGDGKDEDAERSLVAAKLRAIMEIVADRVEMHQSIYEQRNNWNTLLLNSVNGIILAAGLTTAGGIPCWDHAGEALLPIKLSSTLLYLSATAVLAVMNKVQPSQLAEEQRKAVRLFKNLLFQIETTSRGSHATASDVHEMIERVLALDKAYPLPLLGGAMLEKFPASIAPAVWWPENSARRQPSPIGGADNGWTGDLEEELEEILRVVRGRDGKEYLRLGGKALRLNKLLAIAGPALTATAAVASSLAGPTSCWATAAGAAAGALAVGVSTVQHGGQVGMVFELYRSTAGFFKFLEECVIEPNLMECDLERRENGEVVEMKVALMLGRSVSELRDAAAKSRSLLHIDDDDFASKLL